MSLDEKLTNLLNSCRKCVETSQNVWHESRDSVRATREAISTSRALIAQSDKTIERLRMLLEDTSGGAGTPAKASPADLLEVVAERTFQNEVVLLDGRHFIDCTLTDCTLLYGGQPVVVESTNFHGCRFRFSAEAALTVQFLEAFELMNSSSRAAYAAIPSKTTRQQLPN